VGGQKIKAAFLRSHFGAIATPVSAIRCHRKRAETSHFLVPGDRHLPMLCVRLCDDDREHDSVGAADVGFGLCAGGMRGVARPLAGDRQAASVPPGVERRSRPPSASPLTALRSSG